MALGRKRNILKEEEEYGNLVSSWKRNASK